MSGRDPEASVAIPAYRRFVSPALVAHLAPSMVPVPGVPGLMQVGAGGGLENAESLAFLCELHTALAPRLAEVLRRRAADRAFIDERTRACHALNATLGIPFGDAAYRTVLGQEDAEGRVVIGPRSPSYCRSGGGAPVAPIPEFLQGPHVTLFGPPDDAKLSINAMNAFHRALPGEPPIVAELLRSFEGRAMWGADDEDSKTPLRADLVAAGENLSGCIRGTLSFVDARTGRGYRLADSHRSLPIKRFPGLALPCPFLFLHGEPLPLHLYDFALHLMAHRDDPRALVFYVPKLENEEEAAYVRGMVAEAERMVQARDPRYRPGTVRLMVVLENPRALFRVNEIMDALHPYFAGASLGWHDFLASTARLMRHDANYRIPVKADPDIVINHIKASHDLLADVVGSRGGIKVGGMYGVLPSDGDLHGPSFQVTMKGFVKDVVTQMKRGLSGFWVAHPDFVRIGMALVEAWKRQQRGEGAPLDDLVGALLLPTHRDDVLAFVHGPDVRGLDRDDPLYPRRLMVADRSEPGFVANNDPEEVRYNVFQSLQYLTDWLCGNGCVALPASIDGVPIRVMDDLATAERSRWEVWHEVHHGRFAYADLVRIAHEELHFIRKGPADGRRAVQVKWEDRTRKWYPVAMNVMLQLMASEEPVEFATELLLPFTLDAIRAHDDPWEAAQRVDPAKHRIPATVARLHAFFSACGSRRFAERMARDGVTDMRAAEALVRGFDVEEVNEAAHFHGDIGESPASLDASAAREQALVSGGAADVAAELRGLGRAYRERFGFKFLVAAKGRTGEDLLSELRARIGNTPEAELANAREALWRITEGRLRSQPPDTVVADIEAARLRHGVHGASVCVLGPGGHVQQVDFGTRDGTSPVTRDTRFEIASLSKSIAACFAMERLRAAGIPVSAPVNELLARAGSDFRVRSLDAAHPEWGDRVTVEHLLSHRALNMHYVNGAPAEGALPPVRRLLDGFEPLGYGPVGAVIEPGSAFRYSGGGFMVLQHLLESMGGAPVHELMAEFLRRLGMDACSFREDALRGVECASGFLDSGAMVAGGRKLFPAMAAGATATAADVGRFVAALAQADASLDGRGPISHDTAVRMLHGTDGGCRDFMGCLMGLGVFVAECGPNRLAIHQGANDGFRALFVHCHEGPDAGHGLVVLCNADDRGVSFVAEAAQAVLRHLGLRGVDVTRFRSAFDDHGIPDEQRVNAGYRELLFSALEHDLPERIAVHGPRDPLAPFNRAVGARIVSVSNERFARAENLLSPWLPTFDPALFGRQGKVMDSWETVRHNPEPCDSMVFEMTADAAIDCIAVSTQFHLGNQAEAIDVEGWDAAHGRWVPLMPRMRLEGHSLHAAAATTGDARFRRIRVRMHPDGGISRLALYGRDLPAAERAALLASPVRSCTPFDAQTRKPMTPKYVPLPGEVEANVARMRGRPVDFASAAFGGRIVSASNEHYSPATQVISPYPPLSMVDGLESARSREPGHSEHVVIALGRAVRAGRIELDFTHFVNNNPREVEVDGLCGGAWVPLVVRTGVKAFAGNAISFPFEAPAPCGQVRVTVFPDGGMNRVRVIATA